MASMKYISAFSMLILYVGNFKSEAAPQFPQRGFPVATRDNESPQPYDFEYKVDNPPSGTFFGQSESADPQGRVVGSYYVLLPDGRRMNVEYTVDGDSGFVPRITFSPQSPSGALPGRVG